MSNPWGESTPRIAPEPPANLYDKGWSDAIAAVTAMLREYSVAARKDKRYQAANFLAAAAHKASRIKKEEEK